MVVETYTKQVEDLAFQPVRRGPNAGDTINTVSGSDFQSYSLVGSDRKQVVDDLKRRRGARPVYTRQIREIIEARFAITLEKTTELNNACAIDVNRKLTDKLNRIANRVTKFCFQFFDERMIAGIGRFRTFVLFLNRWFRSVGRSLIGRE